MSGQQSLLKTIELDLNHDELLQKMKECDTAYQKFPKPHLKELSALYEYLSKGFQVVDIVENFKRVSVDGNGDPKLAITGLDWNVVYLLRSPRGAAIFTNTVKQISYYGGSSSKDDTPPPTIQYALPDNTVNRNGNPDFDVKMVLLPEGTLPVMTATAGKHLINKRVTYVAHQTIKTNPPLIPASTYLKIAEMEVDQNELYVAFEVEKWVDMTQKPEIRNRIRDAIDSLKADVDPILLHRISANYFAVIKAWDMREEERRFLRSSLGDLS